jgi:hypothetical protein
VAEPCEICGGSVSKSDPGFGICDHCKARIRLKDEAIERGNRSRLPVNQNDIIAGFIRGEIKPEDLTKDVRCCKCSRPHLPYNPLCGPCEAIARGAYMAAPAAPDDAPWQSETKKDGR